MTASQITGKDQIVAAMAAETGLTQVQAAAAFSAFISAVSATLHEGGSVRLTGLGTFNVKFVPERAGRNVRSGEALTVSARNAVKFSCAADLKRSLNATPAVPSEEQPVETSVE